MIGPLQRIKDVRPYLTLGVLRRLLKEAPIIKEVFMEKQSYESKLGDLSSALKQKFNNLNLTSDELKKALTSPDEFISLVSLKTGIPKEEASKKVHEVMESAHIDEAIAKGFMAKMSGKVESGFEKFKEKFSRHH